MIGAPISGSSRPPVDRIFHSSIPLSRAESICSKVLFKFSDILLVPAAYMGSILLQAKIFWIVESLVNGLKHTWHSPEIRFISTRLVFLSNRSIFCPPSARCSTSINQPLAAGTFRIPLNLHNFPTDKRKQNTLEYLSGKKTRPKVFWLLDKFASRDHRGRCIIVVGGAQCAPLLRWMIWIRSWRCTGSTTLRVLRIYSVGQRRVPPPWNGDNCSHWEMGSSIIFLE